jgi:hypothetical protein
MIVFYLHFNDAIIKKVVAISCEFHTKLKNTEGVVSKPFIINYL